MGNVAMGRVLAGAGLMAMLAGPLAAAPRDTRRFVEPHTLGQAGQNNLELKTDPPALVGPGVDLVVSDGRLTGELQGHAVSVDLRGDHAEGTGPGGKISLDFTQGDGGVLAVKGVWNDHKVNLEFGPRRISGRLVQSVTPTSEAVKSCRFDIDAVKGSNLTGLSECLGYSEPVRYTIQPAANAELNSREVAVLLIAFFESPTSFAVR